MLLPRRDLSPRAWGKGVRMTRDQKTFRSMAIGMAIIISFSAAMHVFLIRRKAIKAHRYEPTYGNQPKEPADQTLLAGGGIATGNCHQNRVDDERGSAVLHAPDRGFERTA